MTVAAGERALPWHGGKGAATALHEVAAIARLPQLILHSDTFTCSQLATSPQHQHADIQGVGRRGKPAAAVAS